MPSSQQSGAGGRPGCRRNRATQRPRFAENTFSSSVIVPVQVSDPVIGYPRLDEAGLTIPENVVECSTNYFSSRGLDSFFTVGPSRGGPAMRGAQGATMRNHQAVEIEDDVPSDGPGSSCRPVTKG